MTDLARTASLAIHHFHLPRIKFPKLGFSHAVDHLSITISKAVCLAYVDPFTARRPQMEKFIDADLEGRDPNW